MGNNIEKDRQDYIRMLDSVHYDRQTDMQEFCRLNEKYPAPYPEGFMNDDVLSAMARLEKRQNLDEIDEEIGQLSFFDEW